MVQVAVNTDGLQNAGDPLVKAAQELDQLQGILTRLAGQEPSAFDPFAKRAGAPQASSTFLQIMTTQMVKAQQTVADLHTRSTTTVPAAMQTTDRNGAAAIRGTATR